MIRNLVAHPVSSALPSAWQIESNTESNELTLDIVYRIRGDLRKLEIPEHCASPSRMDNLWQETCFEVFLRRKNQPCRYIEFNLAPSGHWALYRFSGYRKDLERPEAHDPPITRTEIQAEGMSLIAKIPWHTINDTLSGGQPLETGLSVILKEKSGEMGYWAINHPSEKPDFHHPDSFVAL